MVGVVLTSLTVARCLEPQQLFFLLRQKARGERKYAKDVNMKEKKSYFTLSVLLSTLEVERSSKRWYMI
jgi:hypothetical protein